MAPFAVLYTIGHFFYGLATPPWIRFLANFSFSSFAVLYLVGLKANLDEYRIENKLHRIGWSLAQIALLPFFSAMEGAGVLAAIFRPHAGFHVVKK